MKEALREEEDECVTKSSVISALHQITLNAQNSREHNIEKRD
jgi:hypothetical protein